MCIIAQKGAYWMGIWCDINKQSGMTSTKLRLTLSTGGNLGFCFSYCNSIDGFHKSDKYAKMHHFVTEMCIHVHVSVTKFCIMGYGTVALWDLCHKLSRDIHWHPIHHEEQYLRLTNGMSLMITGKKSRTEIRLCLTYKPWYELANDLINRMSEYRC